MGKDLLEVHIPKYFSKFEQLLEESGGKFIAGSVLTYADLVVANFVDVALDLISPDILDDFPGLQTLKDFIFGMPAIQQWCENRTLALGYGTGG